MPQGPGGAGGRRRRQRRAGCGDDLAGRLRAALEGGARAGSPAGCAAHRLGVGEQARRWRRAARRLQVGMPARRRIVVSAIAPHADLAARPARTLPCCPTSWGGDGGDGGDGRGAGPARTPASKTPPRGRTFEPSAAPGSNCQSFLNRSQYGMGKSRPLKKPGPAPPAHPPRKTGEGRPAAA